MQSMPPSSRAQSPRVAAVLYGSDLIGDDVAGSWQMAFFVYRDQIDAVSEDVDELHCGDNGVSTVELATVLGLDLAGVPELAYPAPATVAACVQQALLRPYQYARPSDLAENIYNHLLTKHITCTGLDPTYCARVSMRAADLVVRSMTMLFQSTTDDMLCQEVQHGSEGCVVVVDADGDSSEEADTDAI